MIAKPVMLSGLHYADRLIKRPTGKPILYTIGQNMPLIIDVLDQYEFGRLNRLCVVQI